MPATTDEVTVSVPTVPAGSAEAVYRAAIETGTSAYQLHRNHIFAVALSLPVAASGSIVVGLILAMWLVLRILTPADDLLDINTLAQCGM